jgi:hypothetical protein
MLKLLVLIGLIILGVWAYQNYVDPNVLDKLKHLANGIAVYVQEKTQ